jgi:hypothetical protein
MSDLLSWLPGDFINIYDRLALIDYTVLAINLLLMIFARRILNVIYHDETNGNGRQSLNRVHVFRALNLFIIISFGYYHLYLPISERGPGLKLVSVFVVMYLGYLFQYFLFNLNLCVYS